MMKRARSTSNEKGFTILELMIATVVFSVLLLGAAAMLVQIGRLFYKGVVVSRTQETTRAISDDVSRTVQFSNAAITVAPTRKATFDDGTQVDVQAFCIGNTRYTYILDAQVNTQDEFGAYQGNNNGGNYVRRALWRDTQAVSDTPGATECSEPAFIERTEFAGEGREMLGEGMRLYRLSPPTENADGLVSFSVGVAYGQDYSLLQQTDDGMQCTGTGLGAQWCATSELNTTVFRRIR